MSRYGLTVCFLAGCALVGASATDLARSGRLAAQTAPPGAGLSWRAVGDVAPVSASGAAASSTSVVAAGIGSAAVGAAPSGAPAGLATGAGAAGAGSTGPASSGGVAAGTNSGGPGARAAVVTRTTGTLPNEHGQVWREYDISAYTLRVTNTQRPEQAIVDWILRETGYEAWHSEPLGILSATPRVLRVYHTPDMQAVVADLVERFLRSEAETTGFALRVMTVESPAWRAKVHRLLQPVAVQTPGVGAWLVSRENTALVLAELRRRTDYREHSSAQLLVNDGQVSVISAMRGRSYVRDLIHRPDVWPGYEAEMGQVEEGFSIELSPLRSLDGRMIDASIRCDVNQVEKMNAVALEVPTATAPRQRVEIEVPQMTQFRLHERFRWPTEQVLLVSMGVVPLPVPIDGKPVVPLLPLPLGTSPPRAELLLMVEYRGALGGEAGRAAGLPDARSYHGRY